MKRKLLFFLAFVFVNNLLGQDLLSGIKFKELVPAWSYVILDSLSNNTDGSSHMTYNKYLRVNDSIYVAALFISNTESLEGSYIEAINLYTGKKIWANYFDISNSGEKEFLQHMYINDDDDLELICYREVKESIVNIYGKSQLSIRIYDMEDGDWKAHLFQLTPSGSDLVPFNFRNNILSGENEYVFIDDNSHPFTFEKICKSFSKNTIVLDSFIISKPTKYEPYFIKQIYPYNDSGFISCRYSTSQSPLDPPTSEAYDNNEFIIDFYDGQFNHIDSLQLKDSTPYNWNKSVRPFENGMILVDSYDSLKILDKNYYAVGVYDVQGNEIVTFDIKNNYTYGEVITRPIPNSSNYITVYATQESANIITWNFLLGKSDKSVTNIARIELMPDQDVYITSFEILNDGTFIIAYEGSWIDSIGQSKLSNGLVAIPSEYFETLSSQTLDREITDMEFFPNPVISEAQINLTSPHREWVHLMIYDALGNVQMIRKIELLSGKNEIHLDLRNINGGMNKVLITNSEGLFWSKKFLKF